MVHFLLKWPLFSGHSFSRVYLLKPATVDKQIWYFSKRLVEGDFGLKENTVCHGKSSLGGIGFLLFQSELNRYQGWWLFLMSCLIMTSQHVRVFHIINTLFPSFLADFCWSMSRQGNSLYPKAWYSRDGLAETQIHPITIQSISKSLLDRIPGLQCFAAWWSIFL